MQTTLTGSYVVEKKFAQRERRARERHVLFSVSNHPCRYGCGKVYKHASNEARHAKGCSAIHTERKNISREHRLQMEIFKLKAVIDQLQFRLSMQQEAETDSDAKK